MSAPGDLRRVLARGAVAGAGVAGALATVSGNGTPANAAVLSSARASESLAVRLGATGSPLPVTVGYFWSDWGLSVLGAAAAMIALWAAWRVTAGCHGRFGTGCRVAFVALATAGIVGLSAVDVRTALVVSIALAAWRYIQEFTLRGMVQSGFYGGLLLACAAAVQPSAAFWALAMAWACYLLPGDSHPRAERAAGALVVGFPGVAVACLWGVMRLVLGGSVRVAPPTPYPLAFAAAAFAGALLWIALADAGAAGVGAATVPVLLAGSAGVLGPGVVTLAIPVMAVLSVAALTLAANWAMVRIAVVGLAAAIATIGAFASLAGSAADPLWSASSGARYAQVAAARRSLPPGWTSEGDVRAGTVPGGSGSPR